MIVISSPSKLKIISLIQRWLGSSLRLGARLQNFISGKNGKKGCGRAIGGTVVGGHGGRERRRVFLAAEGSGSSQVLRNQRGDGQPGQEPKLWAARA